MSIHDIALSLQRKIRSDFPLFMLNEKDFMTESFLTQCYSGKTKNIVETSNSLKKDLENLLESTEKALSQKITEDFDRLIGIPNMMLNLEIDITDLYKQSYYYSNSLSQINSQADTLISQISKRINDQKASNRESKLKQSRTLCKIYLKEIQDKLLVLKDSISLPAELKESLNYGPIFERIGKLIRYYEENTIDGNCTDFQKFKNEFFSILQKEIIYWSSRNSESIIFESLLETYKMLKLEGEVQLILRDFIVLPIIKEFMPQQNNPIDDTFDIDQYFAKILQEVENGRLRLFSKYSDICEILVKSLWKASIKILLQKSKLFSPVFSHDYQSSLAKSIRFSERLTSWLSNPEEFKKSQDFLDFLDKWNLPTFFELKKNEIIKPLIHIIKSDDLSSFLLHSPSSIYLKAISQCIDNTIIPELFPKFLRLIFQIISTYCNFITRKLNSETKSKGIVADSLVRLIKDINSLKESISEFELKSEAKEEIQLSLQQLLDPCIRGITESVSKLCMSSLESIKTIPSMYQMTGRTIPNLPSAFISSIFQPIKLIAIDFLPKERIVNRVLISYIEIIQETRHEISRVGELISKYNHDSLDTIKMKKQLQLDRDQLLDDLARLGFTAENNELIKQIVCDQAFNSE